MTRPRHILTVTLGFLLSRGVVWAPCNGISFSAGSNTWTRNIGVADLSAGVGSDLTAIYQTATNHNTIKIAGCSNGADTYKVQVRQIDTTWHAQLTLQARRTADGTSGQSGSTISGGTTFQTVTTTDTDFFNGSGTRDGITMQYQLTISDSPSQALNVPPATYTTTVRFTIVNT